MDLKELQRKADEVINTIDKKLGCEHCVNNTFMHMVEELGEVADQLNKPNIRKEEINKKELGNELADLIFFISRLANLHEIDLEESIKNKIVELNKRHNLNL